MKSMYVVGYSASSYEDYYERDLFVTESLELAQKYVAKFNAMSKKWKDYYNSLYKHIDWHDDDVTKKIYMNRADSVLEINSCYYFKIEVR